MGKHLVANRNPGRRRELEARRGRSRGSVREERRAGSSVRLNAEERLNIAAFKAMAARLLPRYAGEYLAFCDGQLVGHSADLGELKVRVAHAMPGKPVLIVEPEGSDAQAEEGD